MKRTKHNQDGLASIVIVSIIIVILALMSMGFAKISDRELRQSLDRELASQANYAAESGMNDARAYVEDKIKNGGDPDTNGQCLNPLPASFFAHSGSISGSYTQPSELDPTDNIVKYSCIIIDSSPKQLSFDIKAGESKVFKVSAPTLRNMYFGWQNKDATPSTAKPLLTVERSTDTLPPEGGPIGISADQTGVLRTSIYGIPNDPAIVSASSDALNTRLYNASRTYIMYPSSDSVAGRVGTLSAIGTSGSYIFGKCNPINMGRSPLPYKQDGGRYCNTGIRDLASLDPSGVAFYYIRLTALYHTLSVVFQGSDSSNKPVEINNAQAIIDVTGEGNDVLKRLQGTISLDTSYDLPNYGLQSMDTLCKRLRLPVGPGGITDYQSAILDLTGTTGNPLGACKP